MMPKKRQELQAGAWDNITQRCPQMTVRFAPWAKEELTAWLALAMLRYIRQEDGLLAAMKTGADVRGAIDFARSAQSVIGVLLARVGDRWAIKDWHEACDLAVSLMTAGAKAMLTTAAAADAADAPAAVTDAT